MALRHRDDAEPDTGERDTPTEKDIDERFTVRLPFEEAAKRLVQEKPLPHAIQPEYRITAL